MNSKLQYTVDNTSFITKHNCQNLVIFINTYLVDKMQNMQGTVICIYRVPTMKVNLLGHPNKHENTEESLLIYLFFIG